MGLKQKLTQIPNAPGVYFFRDKKGDIIYIGKAKFLRNRVRSYFNKPAWKDAKTQVMESWVDFEALQQTMIEVGFGEKLKEVA